MDAIVRAHQAEKGSAELQPLSADFYESAKRRLARAEAEMEMAATPLERDLAFESIANGRKALSSLAMIRCRKIVRRAEVDAFSRTPKTPPDLPAEETQMYRDCYAAVGKFRAVVLPSQQ